MALSTQLKVDHRRYKNLTMNVILHIGTEKTGTTALQSFFTSNRHRIRKAGFAYLESLGLPSNRKLASYCFNEDRHDDYHVACGIVSSEKRKKWGKQFLADLDNEIKSLDKNIHTVVISNEQFHSRLEHIEEIERVKDILLGYFDSVQVCVYLRRQDKVACSLYSTALKCGHSMNNILPGVSSEDHYYNYRVFLNKWSHVFGEEKLRVRIFERSELIDNDLIIDFLKSNDLQLGNLDQYLQPGRENESLLPEAQEFLRIYNTVVNTNENSHGQRIREQVVPLLEQEYAGKPQLPSKSDAQSFCEQFAESNREVAKQWFNREEIFSSDFSSYPEQTEKYNLENSKLVEIIANLLEAMTNLEQTQNNQLRKAIIDSPENGTRLLADYFLSTDPLLANTIRQNVSYKTTCAS